MPEMIPVIPIARGPGGRSPRRFAGLWAPVLLTTGVAHAATSATTRDTAPAPTASAAPPITSAPTTSPAAASLTPSSTAEATAAPPMMPATLPPPPAVPSSCLPTGDGYLHAHVAGAVDARIDWPNAGTRCQGETKLEPPGIRLSFQRAKGGKPNLLFVFGLTGIHEGASAHDSGVNLTVIVQGTTRIYGTLGDSRCTVDSLTQKALQTPHTYRVEARGFCTQPAHAVRGDGDVLVSTFEFAGQVNYGN